MFSNNLLLNLLLFKFQELGLNKLGKLFKHLVHLLKSKHYLSNHHKKNK